MGGLSIWHWFVIVIILAVDLIPAMIAFKRDHAHKWLVLGLSFLTMIGWIAAMVWAIKGQTKAQTVHDHEAFI